MQILSQTFKQEQTKACKADTGVKIHKTLLIPYSHRLSVDFNYVRAQASGFMISFSGQTSLQTCSDAPGVCAS